MRDSFVILSYYSCSAKIKNGRISNLANSLLNHQNDFFLLRKEVAYLHYFTLPVFMGLGPGEEQPIKKFKKRADLLFGCWSRTLN